MKLLIDNIGKTLIAVVVAILAVVLISTVFIPGVRNFVGILFPNETNYIDTNTDTASITLTSTKTNVDLSVGDTVNLFDTVTALSSTKENIVSQLTEDYEKPVEERSHVFVYKINNDNSSPVLATEIDTSVPGKWAVLYLLNDASETVSLKISYTVAD